MLLNSFNNTVVLIFQTLKNSDGFIFGHFVYPKLKSSEIFLFVMYYDRQINQSLLVNFRVLF